MTRHKVPIARISPPELERSVPFFGRCAGELKILGDITGPVFDPEEFDLEARPERVLDPEGYGPRLGSGDIANTYYSDEEFLAALDAPRSRADSSSLP